MKINSRGAHQLEMGAYVSSVVPVAVLRLSFLQVPLPPPKLNRLDCYVGHKDVQNVIMISKAYTWRRLHAAMLFARVLNSSSITVSPPLAAHPQLMMFSKKEEDEMLERAL